VKVRGHCDTTVQNYQLCEKWQEVVDAAKKVLARHVKYQDAERARKAQQEKAHRQARIEVSRLLRREQMEGEQGEVPRQESTVTDSSRETATVEVDGDSLPVDEVFRPPEASVRARERQQKKRKASSSRQAAARPEEWDQDTFEKWKSKKWSYSCKVTKVTYRGDNKYNHGLQVVDRCLRCTLCGVTILKKRSATQHLAGALHQARYQLEMTPGKKAPSVQQVLTDLRSQQEIDDLSGHTLSDECLKYRIDAVRTCCYANITMSAFDRCKKFLDKYSAPGLTIGSAMDLPRTVGKAVRKGELLKLRKRISNCYKEFSTISDATPNGSEAEALKVQLVRKEDFKILEILVSLKLYKSKLTGEETANHLISSLENDAQLDTKHWRAAMMDRSSTNAKCIRVIHQRTTLSPTPFPCSSHTLVKPGDEFAVAEAEEARKHYNSGIKYRGKMADVIKQIFHETALVSGGVRWWIKFEQMSQLHRFGFDNVMDRAIPVCLDKNFSEASIKSLLLVAMDEALPKVLVQFAVVVDVGLIFCQSTYQIKGDDPLVLSCYRVLNRLNTFSEEAVGGVTFSERTHSVISTAADMVGELRRPLLNQVAHHQQKVDELEGGLAAAVAATEQPAQPHDEAQPAQRRTGRSV